MKQPEPISAREGVGWGIVMALHVLGSIPWDLFVLLCRLDGYQNMPMGYFEESWQERPRADGSPAGTLMRGGKNAGYVELNDNAKTWIDGWSLRERLERSLRLQPMLEAAASWLPKQGGHREP